MDSGVRWSARVAGVALGLVGLSVAGAIPSEVPWSSGTAESAQATSTTRATKAEVGSASAKPAAVSSKSASNRAAARYGWGKVVGGDEFNYRGAPSSRKWHVYNSRGHAGKGWRGPVALHVNRAGAGGGRPPGTSPGRCRPGPAAPAERRAGCRPAMRASTAAGKRG